VSCHLWLRVRASDKRPAPASFAQFLALSFIAQPPVARPQQDWNWSNYKKGEGDLKPRGDLEGVHGPRHPYDACERESGYGILCREDATRPRIHLAKPTK
jgi:hypothetical protein